ncbi:MAG: hypothetical protein SPK61_02845 [Bacteroidales bacterium]|nr:hypothetical protein [Bacteroidales bacterium]
MRKIYLLITAAMLLLSSSNAFAEVIATVGSTEFDTDNYSGSTLNTLKAALEASSSETRALLQKDITLTSGTSVAAGKAYYLDLNNHDIETSGEWFWDVYGLFDIDGTGTILSTYAGTKTISMIWVYGSTNPNASYSCVLNIGKNVTLKADRSGVYATNIYGTSKCAYGTEINFNGTIQTSTGMTINGKINKTTGNVPIINIGDGAVVNGGCGDNASIYAAGYGIWNIGAATLNAGTTIYAKSGIININGATIAACGEYAEPKPYGNGFHGTGDGIVFDSKNGYAGNMSIAITDATITSTNGYAIQEVLTDRESSATIGMTIVNGAFAGAKGAVVVSEDFSGSAEDGSNQQGEWVLNAVTGGKYSTLPEVVADGYEVVVTSDADFPYSVQLKQDIPFMDKEVISEDTEMDDVTVTAGKQLVIKTGVTLTVTGTVTIGDNESYPSQIVVEPGATLIAGANGIVEAGSLGAESLILEADKVNGTGRVLFNGTTANNAPLATVQMYLKGKNNQDGTYIWQHFGLPVYANTNAAIEKTMAVTYNDWDIVKGWVVSNSSNVLEQGPFVGHNTTTNAVVEGGVFNFKGNIIGNTDADLSLVYGYNCIANSYTAPMSIKSFIESVDALNSDKLVWVYDSENDEFKKYNKTSFILVDDPGIDAMQAFFIGNRGGVTDVTIDYDKSVYDFGDLKDADATEYNGGLIKLSASGLGSATLQIVEGPDFSDDFEDGADGEQMETGMIQIYVEQGAHKLAAIATNSINDKEITIVTKSATQYTLSFEHLAGKAFKLTDLVSGAEVEVGSDKTYTFTADANSTIKRFVLGEGEVSADEANADAVKIWSANDSLFVEGNAAEADIEIINLSGVKVASAKASGEAVQAVSISNLACGVYVVRVGNTAAKIVK